MGGTQRPLECFTTESRKDLVRTPKGSQETPTPGVLGGVIMCLRFVPLSFYS